MNTKLTLEQTKLELMEGDLADFEHAIETAELLGQDIKFCTRELTMLRHITKRQKELVAKLEEQERKDR